jgi:hypothetical protein
MMDVNGGMNARDLHSLEGFAGTVLSYKAYGHALPKIS